MVINMLTRAEELIGQNVNTKKMKNKFVQTISPYFLYIKEYCLCYTVCACCFFNGISTPVSHLMPEGLDWLCLVHVLGFRVWIFIMFNNFG